MTLQITVPAEECESCGEILIYGEGKMVFTIDDIPLCLPCAKELAQEEEERDRSNEFMRSV